MAEETQKKLFVVGLKAESRSRAPELLQRLSVPGVTIVEHGHADMTVTVSMTDTIRQKLESEIAHIATIEPNSELPLDWQPSPDLPVWGFFYIAGLGTGQCGTGESANPNLILESLPRLIPMQSQIVTSAHWKELDSQ